jgi:hypothetical protein
VYVRFENDGKEDGGDGAENGSEGGEVIVGRPGRGFAREFGERGVELGRHGWFFCGGIGVVWREIASRECRRF